MADPAASSDEVLFVLAEEEAAPRPRAKRKRKVPMARLELSVPSELAEELMQALAILPGLTLDALAASALERALAAHPAPVARRRRDQGELLVLV
jgi:hypothetical protein